MLLLFAARAQFSLPERMTPAKWAESSRSPPSRAYTAVLMEADTRATLHAGYLKACRRASPISAPEGNTRRFHPRGDYCQDERNPDIDYVPMKASPPFAPWRVRSPKRHSDIKIVDVVASASRQHQTSVSKVSSLNEQSFRQAPPRSSPVPAQGAQQHQERSCPRAWGRSTARPKACRRPDALARRRRAGQAR